MLRKYKIPIIVLVTVLLNQLAGYAVHAAMPDSLRPAGTTRYAVATSETSVPSSSNSFVSLPGMAQSITIPPGKRGDVFITFCGQSNAVINGTHETWQARVGANAATPSDWFVDVTTTMTTRCVSFSRLNVPEGTRTVQMWWAVSASDHLMEERIMIVTVNIHS